MLGMHVLPRDLIRMALEEDLGSEGDLTARYFIPGESTATGRIVCREPCVVAGVEVAASVFKEVDRSLEITICCSSGTRIAESEAGTRAILEVSGRVRSILTAERTALNFAQRLTGVATVTRRYVDAVAGTGASILDTRKTTPGWRALEKEAVTVGGGENHRMGLFDRVMVKDNHLAAEKGIEFLRQGIRKLRLDHPDVEVELEADTLAQVSAFLELDGVDYVLLDNMDLDEMRRAVAMAQGTGIALEASGGITLDTVRDIAATGVDFVSVGALTHSVPSVDLSLELVPEQR